jgi:thymidylate kinase
MRTEIRDEVSQTSVIPSVREEASQTSVIEAPASQRLSASALIVEFIGTPGAGKTTLLPTVIEHLQARGIRARTVVEAARPYAQRTWLGAAVGRLIPLSLHRALWWQVYYHLSTLYQLKFFAKHPRLIRHVLSSQRRRPISAGARQYVLFWFFRLAGCYEFLTAHARSDEALLFDEGFIHRVVQMNASDVEEPDPARILAYVNLLPQPDLVIFPKAPWEICEQRIYRRGLWERYRHKSQAEVSRHIANAHRIVSLTVDTIKSKGWTVIEVDNGTDDLTASTAELRSKLATIPFQTSEVS